MKLGHSICSYSPDCRASALLLYCLQTAVTLQGAERWAAVFVASEILHFKVLSACSARRRLVYSFAALSGKRERPRVCACDSISWNIQTTASASLRSSEELSVHCTEVYWSYNASLVLLIQPLLLIMQSWHYSFNEAVSRCLHFNWCHVMTQLAVKS